MGVRTDGCYLYHLRFADDMVLITLNNEKAEPMLAAFDKACGKIGLQLNLTKLFMRNGLLPDAPSKLNGTNISAVLKLVVSRPRNLYGKRPITAAGQKEMCGVWSI
ncbi:unnamed protein product [Haemonchus placei]|uniref:Reverse transcriptase domain-containing protein n=1 Tax=Haemonchus placei TaxID=6290 RepID=A0A0N4WQQ0_HAEPC|nr:unnamed protein product [Haemonchus placei]